MRNPRTPKSNKRIVDTGKCLPRIVWDDKTPRVDPEDLARALGAEIVQPESEEEDEHRLLD